MRVRERQTDRQTDRQTETKIWTDKDELSKTERTGSNSGGFSAGFNQQFKFCRKNSSI